MPNPSGNAGSKGDAASLARLHIWQIQSVRDLLWVAVVVGLIWLGYVLRAVTVPLLVALLLAYLFEPLVAKLSAYPKMSRPKVVGGLIFALVAAMLVVAALGVPLIIDQSVRLVRDVQRGQLERGLTQLGQWLPDRYQGRYADALHSLEVTFNVPLIDEEKIAASAPETPPASRPEDASPANPTTAASSPAPIANQSVFQIVQHTSQAVFDAIGEIVSVSFMIFLIPFYFYFFSVGYPQAQAFCRDLIPVKNRASVLELLGKMDRAVAGFVRGRIIISMIMGLMLAAGWGIVGVPKGVVVGLVTGVLTIVPYLGGAGLPVSIALMAFAKMSGAEGGDWSWWYIIIWPSVVFTIVQLAENYVLIPVIQGKATNLGPVSILVAVLAGGVLMGVYGMILSIPVAACLKILIVDVFFPRVRKWMRGEVPDPLPWG